MAESFGDIVDGLPPSLSTILLPASPCTLKAIMGLCDQAEEEKADLKQLAEDLLKRPFLTAFEDTLSCLYRSLLANIRSSMKKIFIGLCEIVVYAHVTWWYI